MYILAVLDEYHIRNYLGYFIMDNVTVNNYILLLISDQLFEIDKVNYSTQQHQLRYNDHIINLSMQAFLFRLLPKNIPKDNEESLTLAKLQRWRKIRPLKKLHNIAIYIKISFQYI